MEVTVEVCLLGRGSEGGLSSSSSVSFSVNGSSSLAEIERDRDRDRDLDRSRFPFALALESYSSSSPSCNCSSASSSASYEGSPLLLVYSALGAPLVGSRNLHLLRLQRQVPSQYHHHRHKTLHLLLERRYSNPRVDDYR
jgi:hypothetical protein